MSSLVTLLDEIAMLVEVGTPATLQEAKALTARLLDTADTEDLAALHACTETLATHRRSDAAAVLGAHWKTRPYQRDIITFCVAESGEGQYDPARLAAPTYSDQVDQHFTRMAQRQAAGKLATVADWRAQLRKLDRIPSDAPEPIGATVTAYGARHNFDGGRTYRDNAPRDLRDHPPRDIQRSTAAIAVETDSQLRRPADPRRVEPKVVTDYMAAGFAWFAVEDREPRELDLAEGYAVDYDEFAKAPISGTPCLACCLERTARDRAAARTVTEHDDGLCIECRRKGRQGVNAAQILHARAATRSHLPAHANRRGADLVAPCVAVAENYPRGMVITWTRAYWRTHPERRPFVAQWAAKEFGVTTAPNPVADPQAEALSAARQRSAQRCAADRAARNAGYRTITRRAERAEAAASDRVHRLAAAVTAAEPRNARRELVAAAT
jgi:hypothetical protein